VKTILEMVGLFLGAILAGAALFPVIAHATSSHRCDQAALQVSQEFNVPIDVLRAVTRTETGRNQGGELKPWPWTVNMEGAGHWFETEDAARVFVFKHFKRGARSFDVGCFQINYKWHGQAFKSIEEMFDPMKNARYAAEFLSKLYRELGTWSEAAGAYHSRTPKYAKTYKARFESIHRQLSPMDAVATARSSPNRENSFPLLTGAASSGRRGSLVPIGTSSRRSLFAENGDGNG